MPEEDLSVDEAADDDTIEDEETAGEDETATEVTYQVESRDTESDIVSELKKRVSANKKFKSAKFYIRFSSYL